MPAHASMAKKAKRKIFGAATRSELNKRPAPSVAAVPGEKATTVVSDDGEEVLAVIGSDDDGKDIHLDLDELLTSRLLVTANSGGGKSWLLRLVLERASEHVPVIVLDIEGEFFTLREAVPEILLIGDTDERADVQLFRESASGLALKLLEFKQSAVIDLSIFTEDTRKSFVADFLSALIEAPKNLRSPMVICLDEAHEFAPARGESACKKSVADLLSRGRKRGLCGILATQRLSKMNASVASEANTVIVGRARLDNDQDRMGELLDFTKSGKKTLASLTPGEFWALGSAIPEAFDKDDEEDAVRFKTHAPVSTHPKIGRLRQKKTYKRTRPLDELLPVIRELEEVNEFADDELHQLSTQQLRARVIELEDKLLAAQGACSYCGYVHSPESDEELPGPSDFGDTFEEPEEGDEVEVEDDEAFEEEELEHDEESDDEEEEEEESDDDEELEDWEL